MVMLAACGVASAAGTGATLVFSYPNGFAGAQTAIRNASACHFSGPLILLTNTQETHAAGEAWLRAQQNIQAFTTDFTFQLDSTGQGITFCIQNTDSNAGSGHGIDAGGDANLLGFGVGLGQTPIAKSVAVKFDLTAADGRSNYNANPSETGLYLNGGPAYNGGGVFSLTPENDLAPYGINLHADDVMAVHIVYDGSILTMTLRDTMTNVQIRRSWPVDIPSVVMGTTAWLGFTGGALTGSNLTLLTWSFSEGYDPQLSAPTFSVPAGTYASTQTVSISGPAGAAMYYTTNGQQPTTASNRYTGPIAVSSSEAIQAVAIESGHTDSYVAAAHYQIAPAGTPLINFPSGFSGASNLISVVGSAKFNGPNIQLTDATTGNQAGDAWYVVPVNVQSFTTHFTFQVPAASGRGITFAIQNQNPVSSDPTSFSVSGGPDDIGFRDGGLGYEGLLSSVAVKFETWTGSGSGSETGLYTNGATPTTDPSATMLPQVDMSSSINLHSGHPFSVTLVYSAPTLSMTITDAVTSASFTHSWTVDIPAIVGGNTAYIGFTGGTGGAMQIQNILSWTYAVPPSAAILGTPSLQPGSSHIVRVIHNKLIIGQEGQFALELISLDGRCVLNESVSGTSAIDISAFAEGTYVAMLRSGQRTSTQRIFIK
jgi:hypothetical protein